ncbi:MAG: hypothetical protein WCO09_03770, partial [bacterium]
MIKIWKNEKHPSRMPLCVYWYKSIKNQKYVKQNAPFRQVVKKVNVPYYVHMALFSKKLGIDLGT